MLSFLLSCYHMHMYTSPVCSCLPKALGEKQKEICIFFFYCFAVTKELQKIQTVLKKKKKKNIYMGNKHIQTSNSRFGTY